MNNIDYDRLLEDIRWNGIIVSPFNALSKVYKCGNRYKCSASNRYFTARTHTIFQNSRLGLEVWFTAIQLIHNDPILTPKDLAAQTGVSQKTAYAMMRKIKLFFKEFKATQLQEIADNTNKMKLAEWLQTFRKA